MLINWVGLEGLSKLRKSVNYLELFAICDQLLNSPNNITCLY